MTTRILTIFFLLTFGLIKAQSVSTVFLDTIDIIVNNKRIYVSNETSLRFIPNSNDINITIYNDGIYKLDVTFMESKTNGPNSLVLSGTNFYRNDTVVSLVKNYYSDYEECSGVFTSNTSLQNWSYNEPPSPLKTQIRLHYRLMNFAPIDTSNYKYNYRQGLWVGSDRDTKAVSVSYENDKKNGLAKALYSNNASYNVNFKNNIADNYGQGYWKNDLGKNKLKFRYIIPNILETCDSNKSNSYSSFHFYRNKKTKEVLKYHDLSLHFGEKGPKKDSLEFRVRGEFISITNDTIILQAEKIDIHDFYKKNTDSLHYFCKVIPSGFAKVPVKNISKIYYDRSEWKTFTLRTTLVSLATAFVISPLISIQKGGFNHDRFNKVTISSLGVAALSISFGIAFSQKEFLIKPTTKSNKTWTIKPSNY